MPHGLKAEDFVDEDALAFLDARKRRREALERGDLGQPGSPASRALHDASLRRQAKQRIPQEPLP